MDKLSRSFSDRMMMRRNSLPGVSVEMDYDELEQCLLQLSSFSKDKELSSAAYKTFLGLASRLQMKVSERSSLLDELNEVVNMFGAILNSSQDLHARTVAQVHSFVGMIRAKQSRYDCAIQSFLKALWLQTSSVDSQALLLDVAITEHRLGLAYGNSGNLPQAISLLEKSLEDYEKAKMKVEHTCIVSAQSALVDFRVRHLQTQFRNHARYGKYDTSGRLNRIQEEREYHHSERLYHSQRIQLQKF